MKVLMPGRIEDAQEDQPRRPHDREEDGQGLEYLFPDGHGREQPPPVAQPHIRHKGRVEGDGREDAAGDEQRFEVVGADVADKRDAGAALHLGVVRHAGVDDPVQEEAEEHGEPCKA